MKKTVITLFLIATTIVVWGQNPQKNVLKPASHSDLLTKSATEQNLNAPKTLTCLDTLRYPQMKEQVLGTDAFYTFTLWTADAESMSQTFTHTGGTVSVTGIEFFGRKEPTSTANLVVSAAVYNVDASNLPTTLITSGTITINDTTNNFRQIVFGTPATVTGNYAVVLTPTSTNGIVEFFVNDATPSQSYDENLSKMKSSYYAASAGAWVGLPAITAGFTGGPYDFEMLIAPKVSYSINSGFTATPNPVCAGTVVNFTNTTTPTGILTSRMYNWSVFRTYFQSVPDSTYAYDMDGVSNLVWGTNPSFTYATASTYNPAIYTLGGFWNSCVDSYTTAIVVNPLPTVDLAALPAVCSNVAPIALTGGTPAGGTYSGTGVSGGMFDPSLAPSGSTITYSYTDGNLCSSSDFGNIVVNTAPVVSFVLSPSITCDTTSSFALTGGSPAGGVYSGTGVSGGFFSPAVSGMGTYTITYTYTDGNLCSNSGTQDMTVDLCSGISEENIVSNLSIHPNPATDMINISFTNTSSTAVNVNIYSPIGKLVYSASTTENIFSGTLDVSNYASGLYIMQIVTGTGTTYDKIVVK